MKKLFVIFYSALLCNCSKINPAECWTFRAFKMAPDSSYVQDSLFVDCNDERKTMIKVFYPSGKIRGSVEFYDGQSHGNSIMYSEDGSVIGSDRYVNGKLAK